MVPWSKLALGVPWLVCSAGALGSQAVGRAVSCGPWHVSGPFGPVEEPGDLEEPYWPEKELRAMRPGKKGPDLERRDRGVERVEVGWTRLRALEVPEEAFDVGAIDLRRQLPPPKGVAGWSVNAAAYLYRRIEAEADAVLEVFVGAQQAARVWLDGEPVLDLRASWGFHARERALRMTLGAGTHHLLVKVVADERGELVFRMLPFRPPARAEVRRAIGRGVTYLLEQQLIDGTWAGWGESQPERTALVVEALCAAGLSAEHPAVQMGLEAIRRYPPRSTEARARIVRALARVGEEHARELRDEICAELLASQNDSGLWGKAYGVPPRRSSDDLFQTAAAAAALAAFHGAGGSIPEGTLELLAEGLDRWPRPKAKRTGSRTGSRAPVGFAASSNEEADSLSTSAGLCALGLVSAAAGESLPNRRKRKLELRRDEALAWVDAQGRWDVVCGSEHPYGLQLDQLLLLQRAYRLHGVAELDGWRFADVCAALLLDHQKRDGSWSYYYGWQEVAHTALASLLLAGTLEEVPGSEALLVGKESADRHGLRLTADLGPPLRVWIEGRARAAGEGSVESPAIERLEIRGRPAGAEEDRLLAALDRDELAASGGLGAPVEIEVEDRHRWVLTAEVVLADSDVASEETGERVLALGSLTVFRVERPEEERGPASRGAGSGVLAGSELELEVSSTAEDAEAEHLVDGRYSSAWLCSPKDDQPRVRLVAEEPVTARELLLAHGSTGAGDWARPQVARVEVVVNDEHTFELSMPADPWRRARCAFGGELAVRSLEIRILANRNRKQGMEGVGFSELVLR